MGIGELCTRDVVYVARNESAADAARLMREYHDEAVMRPSVACIGEDEELFAEEMSGLAGTLSRGFHREREDRPVPQPH